MIIKRCTCQTKSNRLHDRLYHEYQVFSAASVKKRPKFGLERGRFVWPRAEEGVVVLSRAQLSMLLEGIDWRMPQRTWRPELAG
jgi:IS66 Orf2 like protein